MTHDSILDIAGAADNPAELNFPASPGDCGSRLFSGYRIIS
jgi:hypothetical protein